MRGSLEQKSDIESSMTHNNCEGFMERYDHIPFAKE